MRGVLPARLLLLLQAALKRERKRSGRRSLPGRQRGLCWAPRGVLGAHAGSAALPGEARPIPADPAAQTRARAAPQTPPKDRTHQPKPQPAPSQQESPRRRLSPAGAAPQPPAASRAAASPSVGSVPRPPRSSRPPAGTAEGERRGGTPGAPRPAGDKPANVPPRLVLTSHAPAPAPSPETPRLPPQPPAQGARPIGAWAPPPPPGPQPEHPPQPGERRRAGGALSQRPRSCRMAEGCQTPPGRLHELPPPLLCPRAGSERPAGTKTSNRTPPSFPQRRTAPSSAPHLLLPGIVAQPLGARPAAVPLLQHHLRRQRTEGPGCGAGLT